MAMSVRISTQGIDEAVGRLDAVARRTVDARPAMREIVDVLLRGEDVLWSARRWKRRADGTPAGVKTGALLRSLTDDAAPGAVREIHAQYAVFGTRIWYAKFMQRGTKREPKRRVLVFRKIDRETSRSIVHAHILGELP